jgi:hypothetical protein
MDRTKTCSNHLSAPSSSGGGGGGSSTMRRKYLTLLEAFQILFFSSNSQSLVTLKAEDRDFAILTRLQTIV